MRIAEITGGIRIPLSEEEFNLAEKVRGKGRMMKKNLNEREVEVAKQLVRRGVFGRGKVEDKYYYNYNELEDVWRD